MRRDAVRLLTGPGPGGVGKTRLALQVARDLESCFSGGALFVDLAPVRDPALAVPTVAAALGLRPAGNRAIDELLIGHLGDHCFLLVLDNFEWVLPAAPLVALPWARRRLRAMPAPFHHNVLLA